MQCGRGVCMRACVAMNNALAVGVFFFLLFIMH